MAYPPPGPGYPVRWWLFHIPDYFRFFSGFWKNSIVQVFFCSVLLDSIISGCYWEGVAGESTVSFSTHRVLSVDGIVARCFVLLCAIVCSSPSSGGLKWRRDTIFFGPLPESVICVAAETDRTNK